MDEFRADLHCHSRYSDGTSTPEALIELAIASRVSGLSITDHDTLEAYREAFSASAKHHFTLLPGIEFSSSYENTPVHILGYAFHLNPSGDPESCPHIHALCVRHHTRRKQKIQKMLALLRQHNIILDEVEIYTLAPGGAPASIGRPHIAQAMVTKGYASSFQEAFDRYLCEGAPCYVQDVLPSIEETILTIHADGGLAVIAHPHLIKNRRVIRALARLPFDGIEAHYGTFSARECHKWVALGKQHHWLITGGSDFHGHPKPYLSLGKSWTNQETFSRLINHYTS